MKNILVLYYTQTGQVERILRQMFQVTDLIKTDFVRIHAEPEYPFPWKSEEFFDTFPESRLGISCELEPVNISHEKKYDLIIFGLQVWYLEPSIPAASFLKSEYAEILNNTPVVTVYGVRNMWINAHNTVKGLIHKKGGQLCGNIVLADKHNNLISVLTIIRWLLHGKKKQANCFLLQEFQKKTSRNPVNSGKLYLITFTKRILQTYKLNWIKKEL
jgi:menaquinone-dependent protoporphyrinogen IX oxidase